MLFQQGPRCSVIFKKEPKSPQLTLGNWAVKQTDMKTVASKLLTTRKMLSLMNVQDRVPPPLMSGVSCPVLF